MVNKDVYNYNNVQFLASLTAWTGDTTVSVKMRPIRKWPIESNRRRTLSRSMTPTSLSQWLFMRASLLNLVLHMELRCQVFSRYTALKERSQQQEPTCNDSSNDSTVSMFGHNPFWQRQMYSAISQRCYFMVGLAECLPPVNFLIKCRLGRKSGRSCSIVHTPTSSIRRDYWSMHEH